MKKYIIIYFLFSSLSHLSAQEYLNYYNLCNEAEELIYLKDYAAALEKFESAFETVPYVHNIQYVQASKCAILDHQYNKAYAYICLLEQQGYSANFLKKRKFKAFKKTNYYQKYKDSVSIYQSDYEVSIAIHKDYIKLIDSLHFIDQYIIRKNRPLKGKYKIDKDKIPENVWDLDQTNLAALVKLIEQYGFPSEQRVGHKTYRQAALILLHNLREPGNELHHPMVLEALHRGEYLRMEYSYMYESYQNIVHKKTFYLTFDKDLSKENLARLDHNRKQIGMRPLKAFYLKKRGLNMVRKWGVFK